MLHHSSSADHQVILAFDFGEKRIGVAVRESYNAPRALTIVDGTADVENQLKHLLQKWQPKCLVVGWPRGLDGQSTAQTARAERFAEKLRALSSVSVELQDEVLSSEEAEQRLPRHLPLRQRKEQLDAIAAQIILESYLARA